MWKKIIADNNFKSTDSTVVHKPVLQVPAGQLSLSLGVSCRKMSGNDDPDYRPPISHRKGSNFYDLKEKRTGDLLSELWLLSGGHACFFKALLQYQAREAI